MQYRILAFLSLILALAASLPAQNLSIIPTTTLVAETSNNTSAANSFHAQSNGNAGAANVSKVDIHGLLYAGATTKIYAHLMPWWGDPRHINIGYNSHDPLQIHRQIMDMISRGIDGTIIDWYGPADFTDQTAKLVMAEVEQHPGFTFAIMVDKGAIQLSPCSGCNAQQSLISLVNYVEQTYAISPAYMRINGKPVITNFDIDLHYTIDWNAVTAASISEPDFIFQHKGGFSHAVSGGSYSWVIVNVTDEGMDYLSQFYGAGLVAPQEETIGAAYKGFNDTLASWGSNRIMDQQCGQTFLQTFKKINSLYNSTNQLEALQLVTWNDYEEATELESGIDNCVSVSASLAGSVLNWKINGNENTIDHYVVYISADGNNLMKLNSLAPGSTSLDLCGYSLAPGKYSAFVQAVGAPTMRNQMSAKMQYTAQCSGTSGSGGSGGPGTGGPGSGGPGSGAPGSGGPSGPAGITLGTTPSYIQLFRGESGTTNVIVNGSTRSSISLSCSNLPVGVNCMFSPSSIRAGASSVTSRLTIFTHLVPIALPIRAEHHRTPYGLFFPGFGVVGLAIGGSLFTRKRLWKMLLLGILTMTVCGLSSCGGGTLPPSAQAPSSSAQSYNIGVNAVYGGQQASTQLKLTLK